MIVLKKEACNLFFVFCFWFNCAILLFSPPPPLLVSVCRMAGFDLNSLPEFSDGENDAPPFCTQAP